MGENIIIYYNDLIDSDNWVTAKFLAEAAARSPGTRVIWIIEPRQVCLGLAIADEQRRACLDLLNKHFPSYKDPLKVFIGGLLRQEDIDKLEGLSQNDIDLLDFAMSPGYGPREDAVLHGQLLALDFMTGLTSWGSGPDNVYLDLESLEGLENPVNLKVHFHEELVDRTEVELKAYNTIMTQPYAQRVSSLREWYGSCATKRQEEASSNGGSIKDLDFVRLSESIKNAKSVRYFGGSSLSLLERLVHSGAAGNMQCCLQGGTFNPSIVQFPNQFNIALHLESSKFVMEHYNAFSSLRVVPSDTTRLVKYSLFGLSCGSNTLAKRFLGFNLRVDAMKLATGEATIDDLIGKEVPVPDLTAFLCTFVPGFRGSRVTFANVVDCDGRLLFRHGVPGISVCEMDQETVVGDDDIPPILAHLALDRPPP